MSDSNNSFSPFLVPILALILSLVWGISWSALLQRTRRGKFLAAQRTWITVVIGVGLDLLIGLLVMDFSSWLWFLAILAVSAIPIITRSINNEWLDHRLLMDLRHAKKDQSQNRQ